MSQSCAACEDIRRFEKEIQRQANEVVTVVVEGNASMVKRNNARWAMFAFLCRIWGFGRILFRYRQRPFGLEREPRHWNEPWYKREKNRIEKLAKRLEGLKAAHMEHWGEESVCPMNGNDPGGYFTPHSASRSKCYEMGLRPFPPDGFLGFWRFYGDELVMDSATKQLRPLCECDSSSSSRGSFYRWRGGRAALPDPSVPGHNEFRDDDFYNRFPELWRNGPVTA